MTWKYECGHESNCIIMKSDIFSLMAYMDWAETTGVNGTKKECFTCYCTRCKYETGKSIVERLQKEGKEIDMAHVLKEHGTSGVQGVEEYMKVE